MQVFNVLFEMWSNILTLNFIFILIYTAQDHLIYYMLMRYVVHYNNYLWQGSSSKSV